LGCASELDNFFIFFKIIITLFGFCLQFLGNCEQAELRTFWGTLLS
jgi:hypothetical protein